MGINRKAINFDLSTKSLEKYFKDTKEFTQKTPKNQKLKDLER
ncbi:hypothetical protein ACOJ3U_001716 [Campylobacter jejuni]